MRTKRADVRKTILDTTEIAKDTYKRTWGLGFFLAPVAMGVSLGNNLGVEVSALIGLLAFSIGVNFKQKVNGNKAKRNTPNQYPSYYNDNNNAID